jgi:hypothetical protein
MDDTIAGTMFIDVFRFALCGHEAVFTYDEKDV